LQLWYLLDHVDGQIARYKKTSCLSGRFFDFMTHHLIHAPILFSLGFYCYQLLEAPQFIVWGFLVSLSLMLFNLVSDTKYKTFYEALRPGERYAVISGGEAEPTELEKSGAAPLKKIYSFLHKSTEVHVLMNVLTASAAAGFLFKPYFDFRLPLFLFYGSFIPPMAGLKIYYLISRRRIDAEFNLRFRQEN
jgi:hypothetical protein